MRYTDEGKLNTSSNNDSFSRLSPILGIFLLNLVWYKLSKKNTVQSEQKGAHKVLLIPFSLSHSPHGLPFFPTTRQLF